MAILQYSCNTLEENPEDFLGEGNFFRTELDAEQSVNAVYRPLAASPSADSGIYSDGLWYLGDLVSDNTVPGPTDTGLERNQLDNFQFDASSSKIFDVWSAAYDGINKANIALAEIPDIPFNDADRKDALLGEAGFLRALYYFNLVRLFGDVPLITEGFTGLDQELAPSRTPLAEVYDQIVLDLETAERLLPVSWGPGNVGRATSGAATSLLAKVYLTLGDWQGAKDESLKVIASGTYGLFDTYAEVFLSSQSLEPVQNENGIESIFEVQMRSNQELRNRLATQLAPVNSFIINSGRSPGDGLFAVDPMFFELHADSDQRKEWNFITSYTDRSGNVVEVVPHFNKYRDPGAGSASSSNNYYVLRYADVLLIYAEAENEINGPTPTALEAYNRVHTRAGLEALGSGVSQSEFRDLILLERHLEFVWEGHRWFDLVRTGRLEETMRANGKNVAPFNVLYPIPERELDNNPSLEQNVGY